MRSYSLSLEPVYFVAQAWGKDAFGNIFFGHFEERTPKWRPALKVVVFVALVVGISATLGM